MNQFSFFIGQKLPGLNQILNKKGTKLKHGKGDLYHFEKKKIEEIVRKNLVISKCPKFDRPVSIQFHWVEPDRRRDLDNIFSAKKFIIDALVKNKNLKNDGQKHVVELVDTIETNKSKPGVWVTITERDLTNGNRLKQVNKQQT